METILHHEFPNGLVLVGEPMRWLESVAVSLRIPAGSIYDDSDKAGLASFTGEMVMRGAGPRESRTLVRDLGLYGIHYTERVGTTYAKFTFATVSSQIARGLEIFADVVRRPHLPASQVEPVRQGILQELRGLADDPGSLLVRELRRAFYPYPVNRPPIGEAETVAQITLEDIQSHFRRYYQPDGAIVAVAGKFDWEDVIDLVGQFFGDWRGIRPPEITLRPSEVIYRHIRHESQQVQIGVAFPGPPYAHPDFFHAWAAAAVLGSGSSSRLFRELREKRGLCYGCWATYHSGRSQGAIFCYASTAAETAQETLNLLLAEIGKLFSGIRQEELQRIKAGIKSALIMSQESSAARCAVIAREWTLLERVRPVEEIRRIVDELSAESINAFLQANPPKRIVVVTVGAKELEVNSALQVAT